MLSTGSVPGLLSTLTPVCSGGGTPIKGVDAGVDSAGKAEVGTFEDDLCNLVATVDNAGDNAGDRVGTVVDSPEIHVAMTTVVTSAGLTPPVIHGGVGTTHLSASGVVLTAVLTTGRSAAKMCDGGKTTNVSHCGSTAVGVTVVAPPRPTIDVTPGDKVMVSPSRVSTGSGSIVVTARTIEHHIGIDPKLACYAVVVLIIGYVINTTVGSGALTKLIVSLASVARVVTSVVHLSVGSHGTVTLVIVTSLTVGAAAVSDVHGLTIDNVGGTVETVESLKDACNAIDLSDVAGNMIKVAIKGHVTGLVGSVVSASPVDHIYKSGEHPLG